MHHSCRILRPVVDKGVHVFLASEIHHSFDLSPDGNQLCYFGAVDTGYRVTLMTLATQSTFTDILSHVDGDAINWSPTGGTIAYVAQDNSSPSSGQVVVFDIAARTSKTYDVPQTHGQYGWIKNMDWAKDESALYITAQQTEGFEMILKLDLATRAVTDYDIGRGMNVWNLTTVFRSRAIGEH
jgi:Tol biopolymer transport system component